MNKINNIQEHKINIQRTKQNKKIKKNKQLNSLVTHFATQNVKQFTKMQETH